MITINKGKYFSSNPFSNAKNMLSTKCMEVVAATTEQIKKEFAEKLKDLTLKQTVTDHTTGFTSEKIDIIMRGINLDEFSIANKNELTQKIKDEKLNWIKKSHFKNLKDYK